MKIMTIKTLCTSLVLIGAMVGCKANQAPDTASATVPVVAAPASTSAPEAGAAPMAIPDTADGIWLAIDRHNAELKATVESGDLAEVHHHAFAIRDLVAALPGHSPTLSVDDTTNLQGEVKFVATLADRLDESGDAGDREATQANYGKLVSVLNGVARTK